MIKVYSKIGCSACEEAKEYLISKGIQFEIKGLEDIQNKKDMLKIGAKSLPTIVVDDKIIEGFDVEEIEEVLNNR